MAKAVLAAQYLYNTFGAEIIYIPFCYKWFGAVAFIPSVQCTPHELPNYKPVSILEKVLDSQRKKKWFDPEKSFFELSPVRWTGGLIFLLFLGVTIWLGCSSGNGPLLRGASYEDLNHLFTAFKFPLAILALLIPFGALYTANHRSEQSRHAAELANAQNKFSNYYKHIDEFTKYLENYKYLKNGNVSLNNPRIIHARLYGKRSECNFMLKESVESLSGHLDVITNYWNYKLFKCPLDGSPDPNLAASEVQYSDYQKSYAAIRNIFEGCIIYNVVANGKYIYHFWLSKIIDQGLINNIDPNNIQDELIELGQIGFCVFFLAYAVGFDDDAQVFLSSVHKLQKISSLTF